MVEESYMGTWFESITHCSFLHLSRGHIVQALNDQEKTDIDRAIRYFESKLKACKQEKIT